MTEKPKLWVDNNILNYWCKSGCMRRLIQTLPYQICTTELVQEEARRGGEVLDEAIQAMGSGEIYVHPLSEPPLCEVVPTLPLVHRADRSLAICAKELGGTVLTNDRKLINYCNPPKNHPQAKTRQRIPVMSFEDFLNIAEQAGWLESQQVYVLRILAGLI